MIILAMPKCYDVSFIKLYHHIIVIRFLVSKQFFNLSLGQTCSTLKVSADQFQVSEGIVATLIGKSLNNSYYHFFSLTLISLTGPGDSSSLSNVERICNCFLPLQISICLFEVFRYHLSESENCI